LIAAVSLVNGGSGGLVIACLAGWSRCSPFTRYSVSDVAREPRTFAPKEAFVKLELDIYTLAKSGSFSRP